MPGSGRARGRGGGGTPLRRKKRAPATAADRRKDTLTEVSLSTLCAPTRPHLLVVPTITPLTSLRSRRRR